MFGGCTSKRNTRQFQHCREMTIAHSCHLRVRLGGKFLVDLARNTKFPVHSPLHKEHFGVHLGYRRRNSKGFGRFPSFSGEISIPGSGAGKNRRTDWPLAVCPSAAHRRRGRLPAIQLLRHSAEHDGDRGNVRRCWIAGNDGEARCLPLVREFVWLDHSGIFPCFLGGKVARLVLRARNAFTTATRVAAGSMTPSSSPRSAARNGLATL